MTEILKRHGLVTSRRRKWRARPTPTERGFAAGSNECWATDFKGQFRTGDGIYCYPLTIQDRYSRYAIRVQSLTAPTEELARPVYEAAFREYGLPSAMLSDNGSPFAASSLSGLTRLSVWWISLGIELQRITPGHPEQNGRLERLHRTLKDETTKPPANDHVAQQRKFATFRRVYNDERPHDALLGHTPASAYEASKRPYPKRIPEPEYGEGMEVRSVNMNGTAVFRGHIVQISSALGGQRVAFEPMADGVWRLHFYNLVIGSFDERDAVLTAPGGTRHCPPKRPP